LNSRKPRSSDLSPRRFFGINCEKSARRALFYCCRAAPSRGLPLGYPGLRA
jgi:hypothetical protein